MRDKFPAIIRLFVEEVFVLVCIGENTLGQIRSKS